MTVAVGPHQVTLLVVTDFDSLKGKAVESTHNATRSIEAAKSREKTVGPRYQRLKALGFWFCWLFGFLARASLLQ